MVSQVVFEGKLTSLRRGKDDVKEVSRTLECGVRVDGYASWREGDHITAFQVRREPCLRVCSHGLLTATQMLMCCWSAASWLCFSTDVSRSV